MEQDNVNWSEYWKKMFLFYTIITSFGLMLIVYHVFGSFFVIQMILPFTLFALTKFIFFKNYKEVTYD